MNTIYRSCQWMSTSWLKKNHEETAVVTMDKNQYMKCCKWFPVSCHTWQNLWKLLNIPRFFLTMLTRFSIGVADTICIHCLLICWEAEMSYPHTSAASDCVFFTDKLSNSVSVEESNFEYCLTIMNEMIITCTWCSSC